MSQFIPSIITPGKHFSIGVYKPDGRPAYAYATEGTIERREDGSVESFGYEMPGARMIRVELSGRNTPVNRHVAMTRLTEAMTERGWVSHEDAENFNPLV